MFDRVRASAALLFLAAAGVPSAARAEPAAPADRALATELFNEARALLAEGKPAAACPKFAESQRLDPGLGTLLNLANCHELEQKTATAWSELTEALAIAERERQLDRIEFARSHIAALEQRLSRLVVVLPPELDGRDVEVTRDGSSIARVALGTAMPIDPGIHRIEVKVRGFAPWSADVDIADGTRRELVVGPIIAVEASVAPEAAAPGTPGPMPSDAPQSPSSPASRDARPARGRTLGLATGGVGLVAVGVGTIAGILAITKSNQSDSRCSPRCNDEGYSLNREAKTAADVSTVSFIIGAVALGAGVILLVTSRPSAATATSHRTRVGAASGFALDGTTAAVRF